MPRQAAATAAPQTHGFLPLGFGSFHAQLICIVAPSINSRKRAFVGGSGDSGNSGNSREASSDTTYSEHTSPPPAKNTKDLFNIGEVLSRIYEIRAILGKGGMGQVFEAHDRVLNRAVAVKASWPHVGFGPLYHEAQAMAALNGRGVPNVYAMGSHRGVDFCVMERLYGRTLGSHIRQRMLGGEFAIDETLDILIGIAESLAEVHGAGLIHRDLKPANIMLAPRNRVVLLDLGLFLTKSNTGNESCICGSPRYIAPEAITATVELGQTHLLDIYALGIIAFILIAGRVPFHDKTVHRIFWKHVHMPAPSLTALRPDVPLRLARLVAEMLAKDPQDRPFSADAVAAELGSIRRDTPVASLGRVPSLVGRSDSTDS